MSRTSQPLAGAPPTEDPHDHEASQCGQHPAGGAGAEGYDQGSRRYRQWQKTARTRGLVRDHPRKQAGSEHEQEGCR